MHGEFAPHISPCGLLLTAEAASRRGLIDHTCSPDGFPRGCSIIVRLFKFVSEDLSLPLCLSIGMHLHKHIRIRLHIRIYIHMCMYIKI